MGIINGHYTLFLRQVNDFTIATEKESTAAFVIANINKHLKLPIHIMSIITRYNRIDMEQTRHYIKIHCGKHIRKMVQSHCWLTDMEELHIIKRDQKNKMGIKYRHTMGEVHYPMIKCQPDISMHTILLSQYMNDPGEAHYVVLKQLIQYLSVTPDVGIYYWREHPHVVIGYDALFGKSRMSYTDPFCDRIYGRSRMYLRYGLLSVKFHNSYVVCCLFYV
jgi:hypothetical protein